MIRGGICKRISGVSALSRFPQRILQTSFAHLSTKVDPLFETAQSALDKSCYLTIDWKINESASTYDAVKICAGHNIGALAVTNDAGEVVGIFSERDYLTKIALLGKNSRDTAVKECCTYGKGNLAVVPRNAPIEMAMDKMLGRDVRHMLISHSDEDSSIVGMISIKDIVKCTLAKSDAKLDRLENIVQYTTLGV
jgi:predicted transcriptional regulator